MIGLNSFSRWALACASVALGAFSYTGQFGAAVRSVAAVTLLWMIHGELRHGR